MGQGLADHPQLAVGYSVKLKTSFDEEVTGTIFALDDATGFLALKQPGSHGGVNNLRLLKTDVVEEVVWAQAPAGPVDLSLPHVDMARAEQREAKALQQAESDMAKFGEGVTKEAQSIFDALSKTMPCRWDDKAIVVMDGVVVTTPYSADSCTADKEHRTTLERVKKVLQAERTRLGLV